MRCKTASLLRRRLLSLHMAFFFGERQMVIWLDSNSNLCEKKIINGYFFLDGFENKNKKHTSSAMPGNQPETSIFQLMSLFVLEFAIFLQKYSTGAPAAPAT